MCELVLEGHEEAVWGVAVIDVGAKKGCFLTGESSTIPHRSSLIIFRIWYENSALWEIKLRRPADRLINLWGERGELLLRIKGSPEPVRGVTMMPDGTKFASACNDG